MTRPGAAELLRSIGLLADGPVRWGQPVAVRGPGLYVVELAAPLPSAPLDLALVGKWLERVPGLRLDGARPSSRALLARLASFWLVDAAVLYAGATSASIGGRVAGLVHHVLGDPRPHADGQWLHALRDLPTTRLWWAATDAPEEYLDALLDAFAAAPAPATLPSGATRPPAALLLPWATTRRPTGERQAHGLTGSVLPLPEEPARPPTRIVEVAPGDAEGARVEARGTGTVRRAPNRTASTRPAARAGTPRAPSRAAAAPPRANSPAAVEVSPEAHARMQDELDQLTRVRRPEVVARIKAARELGDLRENAEYHAAREEQSFLEGRVQLLETRLRNAVVIPASTPADDGPGVGDGDGSATGGGTAAAGPRRARLGSRVTIEVGGERLTYTLVGSTEADAAAGRISTSSPVGSALLGTAAGSEVEVRTPRGEVRYVVVAVE